MKKEKQQPTIEDIQNVFDRVRTDLNNVNITAQSSQNERDHMTQYFESKGIKDYKFTDINGYDRYDGTHNDVIFEVKVRKIPSSVFGKTLLEMSKVYHLQKLADQTNKQPLVYIFFADNKVAIIDLNVAQPTQEQVTRRKVTDDPYSQIYTSMAYFYCLNQQGVTIEDFTFIKSDTK